MKKILLILVFIEVLHFPIARAQQDSGFPIITFAMRSTAEKDKLTFAPFPKGVITAATPNGNGPYSVYPNLQNSVDEFSARNGYGFPNQRPDLIVAILEVIHKTNLHGLGSLFFLDPQTGLPSLAIEFNLDRLDHTILMPNKKLGSKFDAIDTFNDALLLAWNVSKSIEISIPCLLPLAQEAQTNAAPEVFADIARGKLIFDLVQYLHAFSVFLREKGEQEEGLSLKIDSFVRKLDPTVEAIQAVVFRTWLIKKLRYLDHSELDHLPKILELAWEEIYKIFKDLEFPQHESKDSSHRQGNFFTTPLFVNFLEKVKTGYTFSGKQVNQPQLKILQFLSGLLKTSELVLRGHLMTEILRLNQPGAKSDFRIAHALRPVMTTHQETFFKNLESGGFAAKDIFDLQRMNRTIHKLPIR